MKFSTPPHLVATIFVLIDKQGQQRWYGEYPSMWLAPQELLTQVRARLS